MYSYYVVVLQSGWFPNSYVKPIGVSKPRSSSQSGQLTTSSSLDEQSAQQHQQSIPEDGSGTIG